MLWVLIRSASTGGSNEYPQHMFSWRNKKNIMWIPPLICSYVVSDADMVFTSSSTLFNCQSQLYHLLVILKAIFANSVDPDQTAPLGAV